MSDGFLLSASPGLSGLWPLFILALVTALAAVVNSVAGGGTILTFPVLAAILPAGPTQLITANATSTIGLWPGAILAAWAHRGERTGQSLWTRWLLVPSVAGALCGSVLLILVPAHWFDTLVPWLILTAAILFAIQPRIARFTASRCGIEAAPPSGGLAMACGLQFLVAVYGGYFGAGIGILMLAMLGSFQIGDIHKVNAVKNVLGMLINGTAALFFAVGSLIPLPGFSDAYSVSWLHVAIMAASAALGGWAGSILARRLPANIVRQAVALIGFALAGYYFLLPEG